MNTFQYGNYNSVYTSEIGTAKGAMDYKQFGKTAGLTDWEVQRARVRYNTSRNGDQRELAGKVVLLRSDDKEGLGVVSDKYQVVQPAETFDFMVDVCERFGLDMQVAGTVKHGQRFFALARMPGEFDLGTNDRHGQYALISSSVGGFGKTALQFLDYRFVCANALALARSKGETVYAVSHRSEFNFGQARALVAAQTKYYGQYAEDMKALADMSLTSEQAAVVLAGLIDPKAANLVTGEADGERLDKVRKTKGWVKMMALFSGAGKGAMLDSSRNTGYGLLNAITEYYDHHVGARQAENRFVSAQYGAGAQAKAKAYKELVRIAETV